MGKVDLPLIMKIVALIACSCAVGINVSDNASGDYYRIPLVSNSFIYAVGAYLIILAFFFLWVILRSDVDKKFAAIILFFGAIWNVGAGIGVIIYHADYTLHSLQLVAGILGLVAGVIMFIDGLHNVDCF
ncbi:hypothetical protein ABEB36_011882 [Hypothenemus hampei]|uniref:Uncharacterized protein n=1 Tax=Hypothenemus hampei TaxID=57062 RepID=A0ABD1E9D1_HYPHA